MSDNAGSVVPVHIHSSTSNPTSAGNGSVGTSASTATTAATMAGSASASPTGSRAAADLASSPTAASASPSTSTAAAAAAAGSAGLGVSHSAIPQAMQHANAGASAAGSSPATTVTAVTVPGTAPGSSSAVLATGNQANASSSLGHSNVNVGASGSAAGNASATSSNLHSAVSAATTTTPGGPAIQSKTVSFKTQPPQVPTPPSEPRPDPHAGVMWKKRRWPQIGWHKRFFVLDEGVLTYSRSLSDIQRGKTNGAVDVVNAAISVLASKHCFDIDAENSIIHIQAFTGHDFARWLAALKLHKTYYASHANRDRRALHQTPNVTIGGHSSGAAAGPTFALDGVTTSHSSTDGGDLRLNLAEDADITRIRDKIGTLTSILEWLTAQVTEPDAHATHHHGEDSDSGSNDPDAHHLPHAHGVAATTTTTPATADAAAAAAAAAATAHHSATPTGGAGPAPVLRSRSSDHIVVPVSEYAHSAPSSPALNMHAHPSSSSSLYPFRLGRAKSITSFRRNKDKDDMRDGKEPKEPKEPKKSRKERKLESKLKQQQRLMNPSVSSPSISSPMSGISTPIANPVVSAPPTIGLPPGEQLSAFLLNAAALLDSLTTATDDVANEQLKSHIELQRLQLEKAQAVSEMNAMRATLTEFATENANLQARLRLIHEQATLGISASPSSDPAVALEERLEKHRRAQGLVVGVPSSGSSSLLAASMGSRSRSTSSHNMDLDPSSATAGGPRHAGLLGAPLVRRGSIASHTSDRFFDAPEVLIVSSDEDDEDDVVHDSDEGSFGSDEEDDDDLDADANPAGGSSGARLVKTDSLNSISRAGRRFERFQDLEVVDADLSLVSSVSSPAKRFTRGTLSKTHSEDRPSIAPKGGPSTLHASIMGSSASSLPSDEGTVVSQAKITFPYAVTTPYRVRLPVPQPQGDVSLWSVLKKNIGKDLSRVSLPVTLNEPLSALQRLCEQMEYAELLDRAAALDDPVDRMLHVAAFAVSGYAPSLSRSGKKPFNPPFNPVLGETFELVRADKGYRFMAEQVSHHPPVSACYAESDNYQFWQAASIKNKFWGKSMEIFPHGVLHVSIPARNDHYTWKKVTTCVHNIVSGQKWSDHYGEMVISNAAHDLECRLNFVKSGYFGSPTREVIGKVVQVSSGRVLAELQGCWHQSLYAHKGGANTANGKQPQQGTCIWSVHPLPPNNDQYYGFTTFALTLNESREGEHYPETDTRLRPDQRMLEQGDVDLAEKEKQRIENLHRDMRKQREKTGDHWSPRFFMNDHALDHDHEHKGDTDEDFEWKYNGKYWDTRTTASPKLW
ncbi:oxysterol-binding protein [Capsaspora owczarzaki ATCC 30864]|uniref:Oxysterol-binding protein n=1 Tax=Capsaspora owczarzaki (strain ATCC 30864) TaxID=595528 RepID=A0A0D2VPA9_CAPO3|nr:oxysterol-binding protein [Capsaspora owczarzaki ATCC 30864]